LAIPVLYTIIVIVRYFGEDATTYLHVLLKYNNISSPKPPNPVSMEYNQQYCTCMCFLGFIRYNKTLIACRFRKYENVVAHEYHNPLGRCPIFTGRRHKPDSICNKTITGFCICEYEFLIDLQNQYTCISCW
jgi:hypothetical protein